MIKIERDQLKELHHNIRNNEMQIIHQRYQAEIGKLQDQLAKKKETINNILKDVEAKIEEYHIGFTVQKQKSREIEKKLLEEREREKIRAHIDQRTILSLERNMNHYKGLYEERQKKMDRELSLIKDENTYLKRKITRPADSRRSTFKYQSEQL